MGAWPSFAEEDIRSALLALAREWAFGSNGNVALHAHGAMTDQLDGVSGS